MTPKVGSLVWHVHHDKLVEPLTEPFEVRVAYIRTDKPAYEVETRLRLMRPVRGRLPFLDEACAELVKAHAEWVKACAERDKAYVEWDKACAEWDKVGAEWEKARAEWVKVYVEWDKACAEWDKALADPRALELHAKECPNCPWNGRTIFP